MRAGLRLLPLEPKWKILPFGNSTAIVPVIQHHGWCNILSSSLSQLAHIGDPSLEEFKCLLGLDFVIARDAEGIGGVPLVLGGNYLDTESIARLLGLLVGEAS